jgi:PAS domain S-box-containing protein
MIGMKAVDLPSNENERLKALKRYDILDTPAETAFDALTQLAAHIAGCEMALVSFVDTDRQWFKSRYGIDTPETPRDVSFCSHVVFGDDILIVPDTQCDDRFDDNPLVCEQPRIRFYAGVPLRTNDGFVLGSLCVLDSKPKQLSDAQKNMIELLSQQVMNQLEMRRRNLLLRTYREFFDLSLNLLCTAGSDLYFRELNPAWQRTLGWSLEELRAQPFTNLVHPDDLDATYAEANKLNDDHSLTVNFRNRYRHKDGHWVPLSWMAATEAGVFYATATDMSDYERHQDELKKAYKSSLTLASIVESSNDAIATVTLDGVISSWNAAASKMFGYTDKEAVGQHIKMLHPDEVLFAEKGLLEAVRAGSAIALFETRRMHKNGQYVDVAITISPLRDIQGVLIGASGIIRDISERHRLANMKSDFISTVSHELRTPLTSIRGALALVAAGFTGELPEQAQEYVSIAHTNSERLVRLVNDILDIESLESGHLRLNLQRVNLIDDLKLAIASCEPYAATQNVSLKLVTADDVGDVLVDHDRLAQVLTNLISNAAKFSPENADVVITAINDEERVRVEVRDSGPGVPLDFRDHIFQRFAQADSSSTRGGGGTGLGLCISKDLVEAMGGTIGFRDAPEGGTIFFFYLLHETNEDLTLINGATP